MLALKTTTWPPTLLLVPVSRKGARKVLGQEWGDLGSGSSSVSQVKRLASPPASVFSSDKWKECSAVHLHFIMFGEKIK